MSTPEISPLGIAEVALDDAIKKTLDYEIPLSWLGKLSPGMRVKVPVRNSLRQGTILHLKESSAFKKLAPINEVLSEKVFLPPDLFSLAKWMADYYCSRLDKVIKMILPSSVRGKSRPKTQLFIQPQLSIPALKELCCALREKAAPQAEVLDVLLKSPQGILLSKLLEQAKTSRSPVDALIKKKAIACKSVQIDRSLLELEFFPTKAKKLNEEQAEALEKITTAMKQEQFEVRLIYGVTGSGKTEVYLQAIDYALSLNKGVLFLVPEIALTSQMIERLKSRFSSRIAILHSRLSAGEKHDAWHHIQEGNAPIVIGARSALFSPIPRLGLIVVDEEHESSYKQSDDSPAYQGRDVAVMRGKLANAVVLLGSATPSLESYHNAKTGKYQLSVLTARADSAQLPTVHIVDMRQEFAKNKGFTLFSDLLLGQLKIRVERGEQVLLFLNRRGYHTSLYCPNCSKGIQCPHCDVNLTFHLGENFLACHLCDYHLKPLPKACPCCQKEGIMKFKGAGTEMVERALHAILPDIRTLRLDADTTRHKGSHDILFKQFKAGKADVMIGTQMIAKGLHFPSVTLVGVLNADSSLQIPDFRASETVFQLLTQVAGRAGRGALAGEVIIQTHLTDHPVITLAQEQNFEGFFEQEIALRELFHYPPFTRLVKLTFSGKNKDETVHCAQEKRQWIKTRLPSHYELLPVVPCGYARVKEEYRFQFLIKARAMGQLLACLKELPPSSVKIMIDVDPTSTFS